MNARRRRLTSLPVSLAVAGLLAALLLAPAAQGQDAPTEDDYYRMTTLPIPDGVVLEVGGLGWLDKSEPACWPARGAASYT